MIYSYTLNPDNVYAYVIYLLMMVILLFMDIIVLKKKMKYSYTIQILILILYMLIFSGVYNTIFTISITILSIGFSILGPRKSPPLPWNRGEGPGRGPVFRAGKQGPGWRPPSYRRRPAGYPGG